MTWKMLIVPALVLPAPAIAQGMDPVWVGQGAVAQSTMSNARANTRRVARAGRDSDVAEDPACRSKLTSAKRQSIHRGRTILLGKAKADAWLAKECAG